MKKCNKCGEVKPMDQFYKNHRKCKSCALVMQRAYTAANREHILARKKAYYQAHKDHHSAYYVEYRTQKKDTLKIKKSEHYHANKDRISLRAKAYRESNRDHALTYSREYYLAKKEQLNAVNAEWKRNNKSKVSAMNAKRKAVKLRAVPAWADHEKTKAYYTVCAFFNELSGYVKYHVDHVIPLQGDKVSGLHVHTNLRIIPAEENLRKNKHFEI